MTALAVDTGRLPKIRSVDDLAGQFAGRTQNKNAAALAHQFARLGGEMVQDFRFVKSDRALHVLNAPSPGATASLAIGQEIANEVTV